MSQTTDDLQLARMQTAFRESFLSDSPFREDRALALDLTEEAAPALKALARGLAQDVPSHELDHEAAALLTLLSRRAGVLGATPTAAGALLRALMRALAELSHADRLLRDVTTVVLEGYAAGREERKARALQQALGDAHRLIELAPRVHLVCVVAETAPEVLEPVFEELARELLRRDTGALIVEVAALGEPDDERLRIVLGFCATARSLGVYVFVAGANDVWAQRAEALRIDRRDYVFMPAVAACVSPAFAKVGFEVRERRRWGHPLFRRRASTREPDTD